MTTPRVMMLSWLYLSLRMRSHMSTEASATQGMLLFRKCKNIVCHLEFMFTRSGFMFTAHIADTTVIVSCPDISRSSQMSTQPSTAPGMHIIFSKYNIFGYLIEFMFTRLEFMFTECVGSLRVMVSHPCMSLHSQTSTEPSAAPTMCPGNDVSYYVRMLNLCLHNWCLHKNTA